MGDGHKVGFEELGAHVNEVRQVADDVQLAIDASGEAQAIFDIKAFGLVGQVFAQPIQEWVTAAGVFLLSAANAGHDLADRVETAHSMYTGHEANTHGLIAGAGKELLT